MPFRLPHSVHNAVSSSAEPKDPHFQRNDALEAFINQDNAHAPRYETCFIYQRNGNESVFGFQIGDRTTPLWPQLCFQAFTKEAEFMLYKQCNEEGYSICFKSRDTIAFGERFKHGVFTEYVGVGSKKIFLVKIEFASDMVMHATIDVCLDTDHDSIQKIIDKLGSERKDLVFGPYIGNPDLMREYNVTDQSVQDIIELLKTRLKTQMRTCLTCNKLILSSQQQLPIQASCYCLQQGAMRPEWQGWRHAR